MEFYLRIVSTFLRSLPKRNLLATAIILAGFRAPALPAESRLHHSIDSRETSVLTGNVPRQVFEEVDGGSVGALSTRTIALHLAMTATQHTDLEKLIRDQINPSSPNFHRWLTPEDFAERFGFTQSDINQITRWLEEEGFQQVTSNRARTAIYATGTVSQIQSTFATEIHKYVVNGVNHIANKSNPTIPHALKDLVSSIRGLDDFHPRGKQTRRPVAHFTSGITGSHYLTPADISTMYNLSPLYGAGIDGTGVKVAIVGQSDINPDVLQRFWSAAGVSRSGPQVVLTGQDPGFNDADEHEAEADIEWLGAVAKGSQITYVESDDAFTSLATAIDQQLAPVILATYGLCEQDATGINDINAELAKAASTGITVVVASGDSGAADCDASSNSGIATHGLGVDFPASSPFVTGVGGTTIKDDSDGYWSATNGANGGSATSYIPETGWNDSTATQLAGSGGGSSHTFGKPFWQMGVGVPQDNARDIPDVALAASQGHDGYLACFDGDCTSGFRANDSTIDLVGGTSLSAPVFAGVAALITQKYGEQGVLNATLYRIASFSQTAFHDVTSGNNHVPCTSCTGGTIGFVATAGYDQVTGLGSPDTSQLVETWQADFEVAGPSAITLRQGGSGSAIVTVTSLRNFEGPVAFSCVTGIANTTCAMSGDVTGSGTATLTISNSKANGSSIRIEPPTTWVVKLGFLCCCLVALVAFGGVPKFALRGSAVALLVFASGCGGGGGAPASQGTTTTLQPLTGSVTVTAISGIVSHSITVPVTVE